MSDSKKDYDAVAEKKSFVERKIKPFWLLIILLWCLKFIFLTPYNLPLPVRLAVTLPFPILGLFLWIKNGSE